MARELCGLLKTRARAPHAACDQSWRGAMEEHSYIHSVLLHVVGDSHSKVKVENLRFFKLTDGRLSHSSSGVFLGCDTDGCGVVLATASAIFPFVRRTGERADWTRLVDNTTVSIRLEDGNQNSCWIPAKYQGRLALPMLQQSLRRLYGSAFPTGWHHNGLGSPGDLVVFFVPSNTVPMRFRDEFRRCTCFSEPPLCRGDELLVMSSPYGSVCPPVLQNSVSRGVVSNVLDSLVLTDARCLAGAEGAPAFSVDGRLFGIVIDSPYGFHALTETRDPSSVHGPDKQQQQSVQIPAGASYGLIVPLSAILDDQLSVTVSSPSLTGAKLRAVLASLRYQAHAPAVIVAKVHGQVSKLPPSSMTIRPNLLRNAGASVVLIGVPDQGRGLDIGDWGSGILIHHRGYVVTCAHVVRDAMPAAWKQAGTVPGQESATSSPMPSHYGPSPPRAKPLTKSTWMVRIRLDAGNLAGRERGADRADVQNKSCRVGGTNSRVWFDAKVLWVSSSPVDLAVLQICFDADPNVPFATIGPPFSIAKRAKLRLTNDYVAGEPVAAVGHAGFGPSKNLNVSISRGCVAKVVSLQSNLDRSPVLLQTSALVSVLFGKS